jgi:hypothetical protein
MNLIPILEIRVPRHRMGPTLFKFVRKLHLTDET